MNFSYPDLAVLQSLSATIVSVLSPAGLGSLPVAIPNNPALGNAHVYFQAAYLDASTSSG